MAHQGKFLGACLVGLLLGTAACGSSSPSQKPDETAVRTSGSGSSYKPGSRRLGPDDDSRDGLAVEQEHGVLESEDVEAVLERHFRAFTRCYARAGQAQRYVEGQVTMRIFVSGSGEVSDVHVIENGLGNFAIERCLAVEARAVRFPAPKGGKPTEFEYPLAFRSTREATVVDWPEATIPPEVIDAMSSMQPCPPLSSDAVETILYIEPGGHVGSAGFVAAGAIDPEAAMCALEQIQTWRLKGDGGHVLRTRFVLRIPPAGAAPQAQRAPAAVRGRKPRVRRR